ncbi:MAG: motility protein A [Spirochaetia bacterium]
MDPASLLGVLISFGMFFASLIASGNPLRLFWDLASLLLVIVGSFGSLIFASDMAVVKQIPAYMKKVFRKENISLQEVIARLVGFSESARKEGLLSLDDAVREVDDQFLATGLRLVVDGTDPIIIQRILKVELDKMADRHSQGSNLFLNWSALGPAFGMIGTVCGMIGMLANLSDTSSIGRGMALALITTLYGSMLANMYCVPVFTKLLERHEQEVIVRMIMLEGVLSIQSGDNPRILEQKLYGFLPPKDRPVARDDAR